MNCITIMKITMWKAKRRITKKHGKIYFRNFFNGSLILIKQIRPNIPEIGRSLFKFNYDFGICYVVWYKIMQSNNFEKDTIIKEIWELTSDFLHLIPQPVMKILAPFYLRHWKKEAPKMAEKINHGIINKNDYKISFNGIDKNTFEIVFTKCAMKNMFKVFDVMELMPGICRIDYLMFNYMGVGFERTKTLGDGDEYCNCKYSIKGFCEWSPEKGFINRK